MIYRRLALAASLAVFALQASAADDVTGKWVGNIATGQGQMELTFDLKADGMKLMGTVSNPNLEPTAIADGKIEGDDVSFKLSIEAGPGASTTLVYKGKIKGDELELTRTFEGTPLQGSAPELTFKAMRKKDD